MKSNWSPARLTARFLFVSVAVVFLMGTSPSSEPGAGIPDLSRRINSFTVGLLRQCARGDRAPANLAISPQSVFQGLAISYVASGGETRRQLAAAVHFPEDNRRLMQDLAKLRRQIEKARGEKCDVSMANAVWLDDTHAEFRKEYLKALGRGFAASLHRAKFADRERVCAEINGWISRQTRGKIKEGIDPADLQSKSRAGTIDEPGLVSVNAVYFHADWGSRFDKTATRKRAFHPSASKTVQVPTMHKKSVLLYAEDGQFQFLEIPYLDDRFSMYLLLPKKLLSVSETVAGVSVKRIADLKMAALPHDVDVLLPKFKVRTRLSLRESLSAMGVKDAFDERKADFDGMIVKKPDAYRVYINSLRHDAWIEVNEEGTEAAAATTTTHFTLGCSAVPQILPAEFHADHPFVFLVVHNPSRSVLLSGWISNPGQ